MSYTFPNRFPVPCSAKGRSYKFIKLENGIRCLIISDPTEDVASMSLSVATGHHADPSAVPGLAHLCEHMVCVSSKEYPQVDLYKTMVHEVGGSWNAVTVNEKTSFFFRIPLIASSDDLDQESSFSKIIKVFASYFKHPLFDSNYADREVVAVDNENAKNCSLTSRISFHGLRLLANPNCQFHRFSTGNYETLHGISSTVSIKATLKAFFKAEYLPERMAVVLKGPQTLNYLQRVATSAFSSIGDQKKTGLSLFRKHTEITSPHPREDLLQSQVAADVWLRRYKTVTFPSRGGRFILIHKKGSGDTILRLFFPINLQSISFSAKQLEIFQSFWCHILGSESFGSLNSKYISSQYVTELIAKVATISSSTNALELQLALSREGARNLDKVIRLFFDFTSLFSGDDPKFKRKLAKAFSQFNGIELYNFYYAEAGAGGTDEIRAFSERLLSPLEVFGQWFFRGSPCFDSTDKGFAGSFHESESFWIREANKFISFVNDIVSPDNLLFSYVGDTELVGESLGSENLPSFKDANFKFSYKMGRLAMSSHSGCSTAFSIPPPNAFAPSITDEQCNLLDMFKAIEESSLEAGLGYSVKNISAISLPQLAFSDDGTQFWIKKESDPIYMDKLFLSVELTSLVDRGKTTCSHVIVLELLCDLVKVKLRETLYPALVMGYSYDIFPSLKGDTGIVIHIAGPKSRILNVFSLIVYEAKAVSSDFKINVTPTEFRNSRIRIQKKYSAGQSLPSHSLVSLGLMAVMEENTWLLDTRMEALEDLNFATADSICSHLFDVCYSTFLIHGDVDDIMASRYGVLDCLNSLVKEFKGQNDCFVPSTIHLPQNCNYIAKDTCKDPTNALAYFLQTSPRSDTPSRAITRLLAFILSNSLLSKLRIQYQLGYVVLVGSRVFRKVEGIHITIMSGQMGPEALEAKVEEIIMEWYEEFVKDLDETKFKSLYVNKFLAAYSSINQKMNTAGRAPSLTQGSLISGMSGSALAKQHQGYWDQIVNRSYRFSQNLTGEDTIDVSVIEQLRLDDFLSFIKARILPNSGSRIKVSAMLTTERSREDVEQMLTPVRIYFFLSSVGLPIKKDALVDILKTSGDSKIALCKNLLKYYRSQGKALRLISAGLAKMSLAVLPGPGNLSVDFHRHSEPVHIDPVHLQEWQRGIGFIHGESLSVTLSRFSGR
ncbi:DEKNAAC103637 [Brettanomyces naardenensis]|uniref:DEKNAAC103637 n=1 Tax=Brettanomyces naardenensis TaxID=13370 RepID=A0A448YNQ1_BRENA|nr:DEKNAAC103637 [Brettanomyces naardenensis]